MAVGARFEEIYDFVQKNKKFPPFDFEYELDSNWFKKYNKVLDFKSWSQRNYEENLIALEKCSKLKKNLEIYEFLQNALQYQYFHFIFPSKELWFRENSEQIFDYLEKDCLEKFD